MACERASAFGIWTRFKRVQRENWSAAEHRKARTRTRTGRSVRAFGFRTAFANWTITTLLRSRLTTLLMHQSWSLSFIVPTPVALVVFLPPPFSLSCSVAMKISQRPHHHSIMGRWFYSSGCRVLEGVWCQGTLLVAYSVVFVSPCVALCLVYSVTLGVTSPQSCSHWDSHYPSQYTIIHVSIMTFSDIYAGLPIPDRLDSGDS
jgi:hypothetical protein